MTWHGMETLAFPQALGTGMVVQARLRTQAPLHAHAQSQSHAHAQSHAQNQDAQSQNQDARAQTPLQVSSVQTHVQSQSHTQSYAQPQTQSQSPAQLHVQTQPHTHAQSQTQTQPHTHTQSYAQSDTQSHAQTASRTPVQTQSQTSPYTPSPSAQDVQDARNITDSRNIATNIAASTASTSDTPSIHCIISAPRTANSPIIPGTSHESHRPNTPQSTQSKQSAQSPSNPTAAGADAYAIVRGRIAAFLDLYEQTLSRFRQDSLVAAMRRAEHGGSFDFPDWTAGLFDLYDALYEASDGAIDPCVGEDLTRLGYGPAYTFAAQPDAGEHVGAVHGRVSWGDVERHGCTLVTRGPVSLDFGACGKGYAVDLIAGILRGESACLLGDAGEFGDWGDWGMPFVIDAGGDLLIHAVPEPAYGGDGIGDGNGDDIAHGINSDGDQDDHVCPSEAARKGSPTHGIGSPVDGGIDGSVDDCIASGNPDETARETSRETTRESAPTSVPPTPLRIALEHPDDASQAVGVAEISRGALCASAPSRRHWGEAAGMRLHHLLNAIDGLPANDIAAAWAFVREGDAPFPCALADGLATALFVTSPDRLRERFRFDCAFIDANRGAHASPGFPATLFIS